MTTNKSESIKALAVALNKAQAEMPAIPMNARNPFLGNNYADLGSVISTVQSILAEHGLSISQMPYSEDYGRTRTIVDGKTGEQITQGEYGIGLTTLLMHTSGEWIESNVAMPIEPEKGKSHAQVVGSIISYLRRYSISAMLNVYADEDTDGNTPQKSNGKPKKDVTLKDIAAEFDIHVNHLKNRLGKSQFDMLNQPPNIIRAWVRNYAKAGTGDSEEAADFADNKYADWKASQE